MGTTKTGQQIVNRVCELINDRGHHEFSEARVLEEVNTVLQEKISSETKPYIREHYEQIKNRTFKYSFPVDLLEPKAVAMDRIDGQIVMSENWSSLGKQNTGTFNSTSYNYTYESDPSVYRKYSTYYRTFFRDIVSENEFLLTPQMDADTESGGNYETSDDIPDTGTVDYMWVDSYDASNYKLLPSGLYEYSEDSTVTPDNLLYVCKEDYSAAKMILTLDAVQRPTGTLVDLIFESVATGSQRINIAFSNSGVSGVSTLAITGSGNRRDPYVYTFSLYDDNNSNDDIIALLSGDLILTASGSDSTTGADYLTFSSTCMTNPNLSKWHPVNVYIAYVALLPELASLTDTLSTALHPMFSSTDIIAYLTAAKLMLMVEGSDMGKREIYKKEADKIFRTIKKHKSGAIPKNDFWAAN